MICGQGKKRNRVGLSTSIERVGARSYAGAIVAIKDCPTKNEAKRVQNAMWSKKEKESGRTSYS